MGVLMNHNGAGLLRIMLSGLMLAFLSGCLFSPREPEPPGTGVQIDYLPKSSPANVWANIEKSLEASHSPGWEDNISLAEFRYVPDDETRNTYPGIAWDLWRRPQEVNFINNFYNSGVTISAKMRNDEFEVPDNSGTEVIWEDVIYDLTVTNNNDGSQVRYRAVADITFRLEGNFWYIYLWRDLQGESPPEGGGQLSTMGVLRGTFGSTK
jgi:hypothetical protein